MRTRRQLEEQLAQAQVDITEVTEQLAAGELDAAIAEKLRERYQREIERITQQAATAPDDEAPSGSRSRLVVGMAVMAIAIIGIVVVSALAIEDREPGQFATGNIEGRDLSEVTTAEMEDVIAEFPNVLDMRLALARRYFDAGDLSRALPHYLTILEQDPENPEANATLGWMTFVSDSTQSETAATFVERALDSAPGYAQATFYLANIRLYGLDDAPGARLLLTELLEVDDLPDDVAAALQIMIEDAGGTT